MENRVCYKCLLRDISKQDFHTKIEKYIEAIKTSDRAADDLYESRLKSCTECDKLIDGTCLACGCYVEIRAAMRLSQCPRKKW
ncbi:MAG: hypothetical protein KBT19_03315 [Lachnospiraceae bacterium]|nr:hypothetical protein [Candidatus Colinaster equi]